MISRFFASLRKENASVEVTSVASAITNQPIDGKLTRRAAGVRSSGTWGEPAHARRRPDLTGIVASNRLRQQPRDSTLAGENNEAG
jgi:hypothetical protein